MNPSDKAALARTMPEEPEFRNARLIDITGANNSYRFDRHIELVRLRLVCVHNHHWLRNFGFDAAMDRPC